MESGYSILVLGFYMWKGHSIDMASIPVEYCENAVKWLMHEKQIEKVAMTGVSTGAGYTMVCAFFIPEITCIIPVAPYDHIMEGTSSSNKRMHCSVYSYMRWGYDQCEKTITPVSRIKTENMNADVLLLAPENDDCWPSDVAIPRIIDNLKNAG